MSAIFQSNVCSVCLEQYTDQRHPVTLRCGHVLCQPCSRRVDNVCPIDRERFEDDDVRKLFNDGEEETPEQKLNSVIDYLARLGRKNNELEEQNRQLITTHETQLNEQRQINSALEDRNRQLITEQQTQRREYDERVSHLENENEQLRTDLDALTNQQRTQLPESVMTILQSAMIDINTGEIKCFEL